MKESRSEELFMRSVPVVFGGILLFLSAAGARDTYEFREEAVDVVGEVLEVTRDQEYRTTNYPRHEDFYWIRVAFDDAGVRREATMKTSPEEAAAVSPGIKVDFLLARESGRVRLGRERPTWVLAAVWGVFAVPLGLFLIGWGIWGRQPAYPR